MLCCVIIKVEVCDDDDAIFRIEPAIYLEDNTDRAPIILDAETCGELYQHAINNSFGAAIDLYSSRF
jgi:hypothetical protein